LNYTRVWRDVIFAGRRYNGSGLGTLSALRETKPTRD
jgi:hypothetical protein